ncbi:MAG: hypothetical protein JST67_03985 [Bacteroidetes bacterium]|nr:hypothetical protein [Bacteroidota bacterium]
MEPHPWGDLITAFIACAYRPVLLGLPAGIFAFHFSFIKILLISVSAASFSSFISAFLSKELMMLYQYLIRKIMPNRKKRTFTKINRLYIYSKKYIGIGGLAAFSPFLLSIPFGTFLCVRFFGYENRKKIVLYISFATALWTAAVYAAYRFFNIQF